jgi:hypothetical protein
MISSKEGWGMKRLVVVLVTAVLGAALLCLGASQKPTNQTGAPASGVTLTFYDAAGARSYDRSGFPNQSPAPGESESFASRGGTLPAGGTLRIAWSPSEASGVACSSAAGLEGAQAASPRTGTKWRGVGAPLELLGPRDIQVLAAEWNVNLLRLMIGNSGSRGLFATLFSTNSSDSVALPADLARLDEVLDECAAVGIAVIIDLHQTAGYVYLAGNPQDSSLWGSQALQDRLVQFWEMIAQHCANRGAEIYGYDLLNEPHDENGTWNALANRLTLAIRARDTTHAIIVESSDYASPKAFSGLMPTPDSNTIYSFHFYLPDEFASQGEHGNPIGTNYPTRVWSKAFLETQLQQVIQFQEKWHVPVLVGEFGVPCYADPESRAAYFEDCMSLFEKEGFDYCYYGYRDTERYDLDHDNYQAEYGPMARYVGSTPVLDVVLRYFAGNSRPVALETRQFPRCLFDESHWPSGSSQFDRDRNVMSEQLAYRISSYCEVAIKTSGPVSADDLNGIDLLVLGRVTLPLAQSEIAVIESFVTSGGSLLVYGDVGMPLAVNALLGPMKIRFDNRPVGSSRYDWDPQSFWVPFFPIAGVLSNGGAFHTNWSGSLTVTPPARGILVTDANAWIDVDGDDNRGPADIGGPVTLAAVAEPGAGRMAVLADNWFSDPKPIYFVLEVVRWLLRL